MSEPLIGLILTAILAASGATLRRFQQLDTRLDKVELTMAKEYLTKQDMENATNRIYDSINRFEAKLDYHVYGDSNGKK